MEDDVARIEPIPRDQWSDDMVEALSAMQPPTARHYVPPPGGRPDRPKASAIMGTFAHHPDLTKAFFSFNGHILYGTTLSIRQREILVLRLAAVRQSRYLWAQHLVHTDDAGISDADISRIAFGPEDPLLDPLESAMLQAVDELILDGEISGTTWSILARDLTNQQILDLIFTVGCYDMIAWVCGSLQFDLEQDLSEREVRLQLPQ
jgi:alkylhydroperoxidase family enzyme